MSRISHYTLIFMLCLALGSSAAFAQAPAATDGIAERVAGLREQAGFYSFYYDPEQAQILLKIPRPEAGTSSPFILQTSLPRGLGSNDIGLDRGQLGDTKVVEFVVTSARVLLQQQNLDYRANTDNQAERASVREAFASSVIFGFDVVAHNATHVLIDYTPFLLSDVHGVSERLQATQQGQYKLDLSRSLPYLPRTKAFPDNTEFEATVTFVGQPQGRYVQQVAADAKALTLHLHHSLIRLPDDNFEPRRFHPQSGFWASSHVDYAAPLGEPMTQQFIPRHRLHKQDPSAARSEAVEPIVYYLDPGVPEPVRSALIDGAMWWNEAFHAIGYDNAFQVKILPADADPMDVRYNVIQWVHRATRGWSYGSSVIDPRTGEIIKGHVTLGSLRVRQDMRIAEGLLAPFSNDLTAATQAQLQADIEALALARIRQLSAHEVGHTLGIAHNFAASGHDRASVMDYPHPLVSLSSTNDQNGLRLADAYTEGLGVWDKQVVAYGYGSGEGPQALATILRENRALGLQFISDRDARPAAGAHPDAHLWDNGSDAVTELERVLAVRELVLARFGRGNLAPGRPLSELQQTLVPIYALHRYQVEAAVKMIGGVHYDYSLNDDFAQPSKVVNPTQQQLAFQQLLRTLSPAVLALPSDIEPWLLPLAYGSSDNRERFNGRTGLVTDSIAMAEALAGHTLNLLLVPERLNRVAYQHQRNQAGLSPAALVTALSTSVILPSTAAEATLLQQRVAYRSLYQLFQLRQSTQLNPELRAVIDAALAPEELAQQGQYGAWLANLWQTSVAERGWQDSYEPLSLPPGSPI